MVGRCQSLSLTPARRAWADGHSQAVSTILVLFNFLFTLIGNHDLYLMCYYGAGVLAVLIYLVPAAILCWRNRESAWERGWVEFFYLTFQILLSWGKSSHAILSAVGLGSEITGADIVTVSLIWLGFMYHPWICASDTFGGYVPFHYPWGVAPWNAEMDTQYVCKLIAVTIAFTSLYSLVLVVWFGWTLWLTTKAAKTMGEPWTRDLVLKKVSMGKMSKLHLWREGEEFRMHKVDSA